MQEIFSFLFETRTGLAVLFFGGIVIAALAALRNPIDRFFDDVMVMEQDMALRENRLRLANRFEAVFAGIADMGALAKKK